MTVAYGVHAVTAEDLGDVSGSRIINTEYHNDNARPLLILAEWSCYVDGNDAADRAQAYLVMRATSGGADLYLGYRGIRRAGNALGYDWELSVGLTAVIPPGYYFLWNELVDTGCTVTLQRWREVRL